jgi:hypothetical protein
MRRSEGSASNQLDPHRVRFGGTPVAFDQQIQKSRDQFSGAGSMLAMLK